MFRNHALASKVLLSSSCPALILEIDEDIGLASVVGIDASRLAGPTLTLDLHYLRVHEALQVLRTLLPSAVAKKDIKAIYLITGSGNHSVGGKGKLLPAAVRFLAHQQDVKFNVQGGSIDIKFKSKAKR